MAGNKYNELKRQIAVAEEHAEKQIAALKEQAEAARIAELDVVIADVRAKVTEYGLTEQDIFPKKRGRRAASATPVPAKYRNPKTGETWSGRGRAPLWIAGRNRNRFLIQ